MTTWYNEDLAYVHDVGYREYVLKSMPGILELLKHYHLPTGLVVDLGCGSGLSSEILVQTSYQVLGIDISEAMIAIAQTRVPTAEFRVASLFTATIPPCVAVISIGECLSYAFDTNSDAVLDALFQRIYQALIPGGIFVFDVVVPGQVAPREIVKSFTEGQDWIVLVEKQEDPTQQTLIRRIITLRQVDSLYRRSDEVHCQRLFNGVALEAVLQRQGFQVQMSDRYGQFNLPPSRMAFVAYKSRR